MTRAAKLSTRKRDAAIWKLVKSKGLLPKEAAASLEIPDVRQVWNALHRERRRRGVPLRRGIGRPKKD